MERGGIHVTGFDPTAERVHHVGILIGQGVSAWVAHDPATSRPVAMGWGPDADALRSTDLPRQPRSVTYVSLPTWSTLVPDGAFDPAAAADHLTLVHGRLPSQAVRDEPVGTLAANCIYVHDERHERAVLERFPNARSLPLQALLVRSTQARASQGAAMLVHRGHDRIDIAVAHGQQVLLSSSYPARTPEDLLYFSLLAAERAGLEPSRTKVFTGGTHLSSEERELMSRYFVDHGPAIDHAWPRTQPVAPGPMDRWLAAFEQFACVS